MNVVDNSMITLVCFNRFSKMLTSSDILSYLSRLDYIRSVEAQDVTMCTACHRLL